jgi:hypothetical protein
VTKRGGAHSARLTRFFFLADAYNYPAVAIFTTCLCLLVILTGCSCYLWCEVSRLNRRQQGPCPGLRRTPTCSTGGSSRHSEPEQSRRGSGEEQQEERGRLLEDANETPGTPPAAAAATGRKEAAAQQTRESDARQKISSASAATASSGAAAFSYLGKTGRRVATRWQQNREERERKALRGKQEEDIPMDTFAVLAAKEAAADAERALAAAAQLAAAVETGARAKCVPGVPARPSAIEEEEEEEEEEEVGSGGR